MLLNLALAINSTYYSAAVRSYTTDTCGLLIKTMDTCGCGLLIDHDDPCYLHLSLFIQCEKHIQECREN